MQLVEQTIIRRRDPRYAALDAVAFAAKNLYNLALYEGRQAFIFEQRALSYDEVMHLVKQTDAYTALPPEVSNGILRQLDKNWRSFFVALAAWKQDPSRFLGRPKIPRYKPKFQGRCLLIYDRHAIAYRPLKQGVLALSGLGIELPTAQRQVKLARIVPRSDYYVVEVVYEHALPPPAGNPALCASIDLGVDNLAAITSNKRQFTPRLVNGRPIKSINQFFNQRTAELRRQLGTTSTTRRMERLNTKRTRRINHYLHAASKEIITLCLSEGIGTLVLGKPPRWQQGGKRRKGKDQHFVPLPHARFIDMLRYKAILAGIQVFVTEESYTSQASALDLDPLPTYAPKSETRHLFSGTRLKRGLYRASDGRTLNADVNGSANILRKVVPNAFGADGIEAVAVRPVWIPILTDQPRALAGTASTPIRQ